MIGTDYSLTDVVIEAEEGAAEFYHFISRGG